MLEIIEPVVDELYWMYISRILQSRKNEKLDEYQERHHIIPRCLHGTNDEDNLIYLFPQEHYYAHKLLALENPEEDRLQHAWWFMCHDKGDQSFISPDDYAEARKRHAKAQSERMSGENHPLWGTRLSDQTKQRIAEGHKGKPGRKLSTRERENLSKNRQGALNPMYGKIGQHKSVRCLETGEIFYTILQANKWVGFKNLNSHAIGEYLHGRQEYAGRHPITKEKLHWEYIVSEED